MAYQVVVRRSAEKELGALSTQIRDRIAVHLLALEENPRPFGVKKLRGHTGYRLRVGHRREIYR